MSRPNIAIAAIDEAINSLSASPNQFSFSINSTGTSVTSYGGTGLSVTAVGGGLGSHTVGFKSSASIDGNQIQIIQNKVDAMLKSEADKAIQILKGLRAELTSKEPKKDKVSSWLTKLKETYLPPIVTSVISQLIISYLGI